MTVLCVDTNWIALYSLKKKVKRILPSATVYTCRKADEALDLAQKLGCDVLITEIDFGGEKEEGITLASSIKERNPYVNIIFATAGSAREYAQHLVKLRYSGLLTKPFGTEELREELGNLRYNQVPVSAEN